VNREAFVDISGHRRLKTDSCRALWPSPKVGGAGGGVVGCGGVRVVGARGGFWPSPARQRWEEGISPELEI